MKNVEAHTKLFVASEVHWRICLGWPLPCRTSLLLLLNLYVYQNQKHLGCASFK